MASFFAPISPPTGFTSLSFSSSVPKTSQYSLLIISSKATNDRYHTTRRDVLFGLGGLYGATICSDLARPVSMDFTHGKVSLAAETKNSFPLVLESVTRTSITRPKKSRSKKEKEEEEEVLVIDGIEFDAQKPVKFDVTINDDEGSPSGPSKAEFAGAFVSVPHAVSRKKVKTCLRLGITDLLDELGANDDDSLVVTLVPRFGLVSIRDIKIDFMQD